MAAGLVKPTNQETSTLARINRLFRWLVKPCFVTSPRRSSNDTLSAVRVLDFLILFDDWSHEHPLVWPIGLPLKLLEHQMWLRDNRGLTEAMEGSALKWLGKVRKMALQNCKNSFYMEFGFNWLKGGSRRGQYKSKYIWMQWHGLYLVSASWRCL